MTNDRLINKNGFGIRVFGIFFVLVVAAFLLSCVAAVPVIIYYQSTKHFTATVQVDAKAEDVYQTALRIVEEQPNVKLVKKDDEKLIVEAKLEEKEGSIKAVPISANKCQLIATADAGDKEADKEMALRIVKRICDELGVKYTVVEK